MKLRFQLFLVVSAFSVSSLFTQNTLKIGVAEGAALSEQKISFELKTAEQQIKATNEELTADVKALENANVVLSENSSTNLSMMIAEVIASLGLALLLHLYLLPPGSTLCVTTTNCLVPSNRDRTTGSNYSHPYSRKIPISLCSASFLYYSSQPLYGCG